MSRSKLTRVAVLVVLLCSALAFGVPAVQAATGGVHAKAQPTSIPTAKDSPSYVPDGTAHVVRYPVPDCPMSQGCYEEVRIQGWLTTHAPTAAERAQLKAGTSTITVPYTRPASGPSPSLVCCGGGTCTPGAKQNLTIDNSWAKFILGVVEVVAVDFWTSDTYDQCTVSNVYLDPQEQCFQAFSCTGTNGVQAVWDPVTMKAVDFANCNFNDNAGAAHTAYMRT